MTVPGLLANVRYCATYAVDIPLLRSSLAKRWRRFRPPFSGWQELFSQLCWQPAGLLTKFIPSWI